MKMEDYQRLAQRTARHDQSPRERLIVASLGLAGESGEVAELVKKNIGHGHELDPEKIMDELGDTLWYIQETCASLGFNMAQVAERNLLKLRGRYPKGFDAQRSKARYE